jgi:hypothetical protein
MKNLSRLSLVFVIVVILLVSLYFLKGDVIDKDNTSGTKYGISGYVPSNFPNSSISDLNIYWKDINRYSDIYGIHLNWNEVETALNLSKNVKGDTYVLFGFQTPSDWKNSGKVIENIDRILKERENIKYIGIGNEINLIQSKYPKEFSTFKSEFKKIAIHVNTKYPDVGLFTSFQYDSLLGKAKLMSINQKSSLSLVKEFESDVDFVGYTVYPFLEYGDVKSIPATYFSDLESISTKPYAITETSWPTQDLKFKDFNFSEEMQSEYLKKILGLPDSKSLLFINIVFLNDIADWKSGNSSKNPLFDSLGLRYNSGQEKQAFYIWEKRN